MWKKGIIYYFLPRLARTNYLTKRYWVIFVLVGHIPAIYSENPYSPVILFLGDSLTAGYGIEKAQAYPALIEKKIQSEKLQAKVINAGVSGNTTAGGLRRLDWYFREKIDYLVIALGGNDGLRGLNPEETKKNVKAIIVKARLKYPNIEIILAGMLVPPNMGADYSQEFRKIFSELAAEQNTKLIPFLLENVGGVKTLNLPDGIHPNPKGQEIVCNNVWRILAPLLRE